MSVCGALSIPDGEMQRRTAGDSKRESQSQVLVICVACHCERTLRRNRLVEWEIASSSLRSFSQRYTHWEHHMITETREALMDQLKVKAPKPLLTVDDLHVW